jgi:cell division transport system permease protein
MKIRTFKYSFGEGIRSIKRNRVMSIASIMTVTATLFVFGVFLLLIYNVNSIITSVEDKIEIKVYLNDDITTLKKQGIEASIKDIEGVKSVTYISKEQALENFRKQLGENGDFAKGLEIDNPLPPSFVVKVTDPKLVVSVSSQINGIPGVYQIKDGRDVVNKVMNIVSFVRGTSIILMLILGIVSTFLISNTIKLTVYARKKEIAIMKYIGATDGL